MPQQQYLITISIGPVQDFIAAARKTRDLWMGSYLLSEISKAAAKSLDEQKGSGELIFPYPDNAADLEPCDKVENCFNVGNKLLAIIETSDPKAVVENAKEAAQERWEGIAIKAKEKANVFDDLWNKQMDAKDVLEFFAVWVQFNPGSDDYKKKRERLDTLLNARKNTRDFIQNPITENGIPKSSLDGLRENVIDHDQFKDQWGLRKAGLNKGEFLDITGVAKRLGKNPDQFTPLSRLAIDPWLRGMPEDINLEPVKAILEQLLDYGLCTRVSGNQGIYEKLPYDGQLLFLSRIEAEKNKIKPSTKNPDIKDNKVIELLGYLEQQVESLYKQYDKKPQPYMAILVADGDRMGDLLDKVKGIAGHQNVSAQLTQFAKKVPAIVRKYRGHCVYAGGDDVMALLPLDQVIACSKELADEFKQTMGELDEVKQLVATNDISPPTLSVGLGISHVMTPMPRQLDLARKAESLAKGNDLPDDRPKNALAVIISPRSGAEISFREKWNNSKDTGAEQILYQWIDAHINDKIPRQAGYNLRETAIQLNWATENNDLITKEAKRIMSRKQTSTGDVEDDWIKKVSSRVGASGVGLSKAADELIMTYRIAEAYKIADTAVPVAEASTPEEG